MNLSRKKVWLQIGVKHDTIHWKWRRQKSTEELDWNWQKSKQKLTDILVLNIYWISAEHNNSNNNNNKWYLFCSSFSYCVVCFAFFILTGLRAICWFWLFFMSFYFCHTCDCSSLVCSLFDLILFFSCPFHIYWIHKFQLKAF